MRQLRSPLTFPSEKVEYAALRQKRGKQDFTGSLLRVNELTFVPYLGTLLE